MEPVGLDGGFADEQVGRGLAIVEAAGAERHAVDDRPAHIALDQPVHFDDRHLLARLVICLQEHVGNTTYRRRPGGCVAGHE